MLVGHGTSVDVLLAGVPRMLGAPGLVALGASTETTQELLVAL